MLRSRGFTIVELLIVIVVIAILAAISVAAYSNISNRANDSAVQSDLSGFAKKVKLIHAEHGEYPRGDYMVASEGASATGNIANQPSYGLSYSVSRDSYVQPTSAGAANFMYCTDSDSFAVVARSASGKIFRYSISFGLEEVESTSFSLARCTSTLDDYPRTVAYGYFRNSGGWQDWTK